MVNYRLLETAAEAYEVAGYKRIEVPWIVCRDAMQETAHDRIAHNIWLGNAEVGFLVGSAEQSFIHMMIAGQLPPGKYQAITPCFRNDTLSHTHRTHFMKLELIIVNGTEQQVTDVMADAMVVLQDLSKVKLKTVNMMAHYDIVTDVQSSLPNAGDVEIGSYGFRASNVNPDIKWVYGTGMAEPRFSTFCR